MLKKHKRATIIVICTILAFVLFFPYIKAEVLTLKYGDEFEGLQKQTNMLGELEYLKVLSYSSDTAEVLYITDSGDLRCLLTFAREPNDEWEVSEWKTIWSKSGSADEFMWPFYF